MSDGSGRYVLRDSNVSAFFHESGFALSLIGVDKSAAEDDPGTQGSDPRVTAAEPKPLTTWALRWNLVGAKAKAPRPEGELATRLNHFGGARAKWKEDVRTYRGMTWDGVYPGVDMHVQSHAHGFEYRFVVAPGADASAIRVQREGVDAIRVVEDGRTLELQTGMGVLREQGLRCYQDFGGEQRDVACRFALSAPDTVVISIEGKLDASRALVIDPQVWWSSYLGGSGSDVVYAVAADASGSVYLTGSTSTAVGFPTTGGFQPAIGGGQDAFVTKVNPDGTSIAWSSYLGGTSTEIGWGIAVDTSGYVYVTGYTQSSVGFPTPGGFKTTLSGGMDGFVTKVSTTGTLVWSSYLGGIGSDQGKGIAIDASGNVYVTGYTSSTSGFATGGAFDTTLGGGQDAFVAKITGTGSGIVWLTYLGGSGTEQGSAIAVDASGYVYLTGYTTSPDFPFMAPFDSTMNGTSDAFVTKLNPVGSGLMFSSVLGGTGGEVGFGIAVDLAGYAYLTGYTSSTSGFPTSGGFDPTFNGGSDDAFVAKVNPPGSSLAWSTYLGGSASEWGYGIALDSSFNVYVTGYTQSPGFPISGAFDPLFNGTRDAFVTKLSTNGTMTWSSFLGGSGDETAYGIASNGSGTLYVAGSTSSTDFGTSGAFQPVNVDTSDSFVAMIATPLPLGASCTIAGSCTTGFCVDGVCCNSACTGGCDACNLAGLEGTCSAQAAGFAGSPSCSPFVCNGGASCPTSCTSDTDCIAGDYCSGGSCVPQLANGNACSGASACTSGFCADGVCCDSACGGGCDACNLAGSVGTCTNRAVGFAGSPSCSPYLCDGSAACPTSCTLDAECITGDYCNGTSCVPKVAIGAACTATNQCAAGTCFTGVCAVVAIPTLSEWGLALLACVLAGTTLVAARRRRRNPRA